MELKEEITLLERKLELLKQIIELEATLNLYRLYPVYPVYPTYPTTPVNPPWQPWTYSSSNTERKCHGTLDSMGSPPEGLHGQGT